MFCEKCGKEIKDGFADVSLDECKGFYYIGKIVGK